ncbi:MAG: hypothetical protein ACD_45C00383G0010 [uncultured bacterium]|nr:MAG: hypothetical protein ACD_45C00383G0010 [uncultured bacterium]
MKLSDLLTNLCPPALRDKDIADISLDSRLIKPGALFLALPGTQLNGQAFIDEAMQKGAAAVLIEAENDAVNWHRTLPVISIPELKARVGELAARFYDYPAKKMRIAGVTGTSGKTSCTQIVGAILHRLQVPCGIVGTLGNGLYGTIHASSLTTPDAITLQRTLADFVQQGAKIAAMEVSSHSLDQGRVNGIGFTVGVFTNLTRDHLDYHGTMKAYGEAKKRLFIQTSHAVINADDAFGREIIASLPPSQPIFGFSIEKNNSLANMYAEKCYFDHTGIRAKLITPWGEGDLFSPLVGQFNLSNLLAALTTVCLLDVPFKTALNCLSHITPAPGRMQFLRAEGKPLIVVDYAHKPDALEKVLITLRQQCHGKLYCVLGCGGDRDRGKRPLMAKIAEQYADGVVVTDDNPRHEDPKQIVIDMLEGFSGSVSVIVEHDRFKAIRDTIQYAGPDDYVLIAGKGAEMYQQIGNEKIPFSDLAVVKEILDRR